MTKRLQEQDSNMHCPLKMIVLKREKNEPQILGPEANMRLAVELLIKHRLEAKFKGNKQSLCVVFTKLIVAGQASECELPVPHQWARILNSNPSLTRS